MWVRLGESGALDFVWKCLVMLGKSWRLHVRGQSTSYSHGSELASASRAGLVSVLHLKCLSLVPLKTNPAIASTIILLLRLSASNWVVGKAATRNMSQLSKLMRTNCHWFQFRCLEVQKRTQCKLKVELWASNHNREQTWCPAAVNF